MMYDGQTQDKAFIDMMHDFVESHRSRRLYRIVQSRRRKTYDQGDGLAEEWPP